MEKKMENEMETREYMGIIRVIIRKYFMVPGSLLQVNFCPFDLQPTRNLN